MTRDLDDALRETPNATLYILRDDLRGVLIRDQADRDAIASRLMRYRDQNGQDWADIIDFLTMHPEARRKVARCWRRSTQGPYPTLSQWTTLNLSRLSTGSVDPSSRVRVS